MGAWWLVVVSYLLGSLSSAVIVSRLMKLPDPRQQGSKNPGATNVLRLGGKKAAAITLLGDFLKGLLPVLLARFFAADEMILALVGLAAFIGHIYPVFFGFQGGKGVATALGVLLGIAWPVGLAVLLTWVAMAAIFRISSLSALTASLLAPFYAAGLVGTPITISAVALMSLILIIRHRENIRRLLKGEEGKLGR